MTLSTRTSLSPTRRLAPVAVLLATLAVATDAGPQAVLGLLPVLLLVLPLLRGRYVGERLIERARRAMTRRRRWPATTPPAPARPSAVRWTPGRSRPACGVRGPPVPARCAP